MYGPPLRSRTGMGSAYDIFFFIFIYFKNIFESPTLSDSCHLAQYPSGQFPIYWEREKKFSYYVAYSHPP